MSTTIPAMPRPRGVLEPWRRSLIAQRREELRSAEVNYRVEVVLALTHGASFSEVSKATGLSTNTLQRWKREASA